MFPVEIRFTLYRFEPQRNCQKSRILCIKKKIYNCRKETWRIENDRLWNYGKQIENSLD